MIELLDDVWYTHQQAGYACISQKTERWEDHIFKYSLAKELDDGKVPQNRQEVYFCPNLFKEGARRGDCVLPSIWLYADLDAAGPGLAIPPTAVWETSPGRWQALWELTYPLAPDKHQRLNQKLTYFCNGDIGGWASSKVLRVPGSVSVKHGEPYEIQIPTLRSIQYDPQWLWEQVKHVTTDEVVVGGQIDVESTTKARKLMRKVPAKLRPLVRRKMVTDRSKHLYHIIAALREAGFDANETATIAQLSPVALEKYGARFQDQLQVVVAKVYAKQLKPKAINNHGSASGSVFRIPKVRSKRFMAKKIAAPKWLIENIWSDEAHGMIAGEHKAFKSLIALDLAVSVASGTKFLNHFSVPRVGHVLFIQEENPPAFIQDRLHKLYTSRGIGGKVLPAEKNELNLTMPDDIPLDLVMNMKFHLTDENHLNALYQEVEENNTKLVVLDPLYLMIPGVDENSAHAMTPILEALLRIKQELNCGVLLIHHYKKQDRDAPYHGEDDRISGTGTFGRWYESLMLVERGDSPTQVRLIPKHRMEANGTGLTVDFDMGPMGDPYYNPIVTIPRDEAADLFASIREAVKDEPGITVASLSKELGMRGERLKRTIGRMTDVRIREMSGKQSPKLYLRKGRG